MFLTTEKLTILNNYLASKIVCVPEEDVARWAVDNILDDSGGRIEEYLDGWMTFQSAISPSIRQCYIQIYRVTKTRSAV